MKLFTKQLKFKLLRSGEFNGRKWARIVCHSDEINENTLLPDVVEMSLVNDDILFNAFQSLSTDTLIKLEVETSEYNGNMKLKCIGFDYGFD